MSDPLASSALPLERECTSAALQRGLRTFRVPAEWTLPALAGRLVEVSGDEAGASLTFVFRLVLEAQRKKEPAAWICAQPGLFYPPDVAEMGVDIQALPVVRANGMPAAMRAADHLLRSGAFGVMVLDLGGEARVPLNAQTRLAGLAKQHDTALLCITEGGARASALGSLVSLRARTARTRRENDRFRCEVHVIKDKRRGPGWKHAEVCRGPDGLC